MPAEKIKSVSVICGSRTSGMLTRRRGAAESALHLAPKSTVKPGKNTNSIRPGILFVFFGFVFVSWKEKNSGRILLVFFRLKARNTCRIRIRIFRKEFIPPENTFRSYFFSARQYFSKLRKCKCNFGLKIPKNLKGACVGSGKTDPVQFKRGFKNDGLLAW